MNNSILVRSGILILLFLAGCSERLDQKLVGNWQSSSGPRMTIRFEAGGKFSLRLYAQPDVPFDMDSTGSYTITSSKAFTILEGGEHSDGTLVGDELVITKRGGLTSRFRKLN